jgi:hypothetical protein
VRLKFRPLRFRDEVEVSNEAERVGEFGDRAHGNVEVPPELARTLSGQLADRPSGRPANRYALEAGGARRLGNESFFSAPQLKRDA